MRGESGVLWVAHPGVWAAHGEPPFALRRVEDSPGRGEKSGPSEDEEVAENMDGVRMRISLEAEKRVPEVSSIVREGVEPRKPAPQPTGEDVER
jgi:hypothetical protein